VSQESLSCCKTQTDKATSHAEATMTHTQVASPTDIREVKFYLTAHGYNRQTWIYFMANCDNL